MTTTTPQLLDRVSSPTRRWKLDPKGSTAEFDVRTFWGLSTVHGTFDRFDGYYLERPEGPAIELTIDPRGLDTGNTTRDRHLRSQDFFDVETHPQVRFSSIQVDDLGGTLAITGMLEVGARSVVLQFDADVRRDGDTLTIEATTAVDHRELGMTHSPLGMIRPPATLHVRARLAPDETT